ncbi:hypothetical protein 015DV002_57 [Bacillus phage 015DV002]|nr:hypothetical protein 000TH008_70 [Bacillus phage 000TH008]QQO40764.1 hypothetical protein 000TH009_70 [Bacillus phage 000TH009]QQO41013.1 hypothetical protein 015DV002_57 [Bacillus phage 015DV002]QQO41289.1 hypothetical protein 015DV004_73 [Bacillus phage 015DV004]
MKDKKINIWVIGGIAALINLIFIQGSIKRMLITLLVACVVAAVLTIIRKKSIDKKGDRDEE